MYAIEGFLEINEGHAHHITSVYSMSPGFRYMDKKKLSGIALAICPLIEINSPFITKISRWFT